MAGLIEAREDNGPSHGAGATDNLPVDKMTEPTPDE